MIYPKKINANKSEKIIKISIMISILVAIILTLINRLTTPNIPWAAIANSGIIYLWIVVWYSVEKNINIAGHVLIQSLAVSLLTAFIDYKIGFTGWSLSISIPIIIIIANATMLVLTIISYKKYIKYAIYQLIILLFSILPIIFISEKLIKFDTLSIISIIISIINLAITMILSFRDVKDAIVRKFHI